MVLALFYLVINFIRGAPVGPAFKGIVLSIFVFIVGSYFLDREMKFRNEINSISQTQNNTLQNQEHINPPGDFYITQHDREKFIKEMQELINNNGMEQALAMSVNKSTWQLAIIFSGLKAIEMGGELKQADLFDDIKGFIKYHKLLTECFFNNPDFEQTILDLKHFNLGKEIFNNLDPDINRLYAGIENNNLQEIYGAILSINDKYKALGIKTGF